MADQQPNISVIDPVGTAFERVKLMLFQPFDLGRWFVIGFCAWLAYLGQGGGPNFQFPRGRGGPSPQGPVEFFEANLHWIIPVIIIVVVLSIALGLLICWLSSRGRFMFLHCVAQNKSEVKVPWAKYRREGNSLFVFRFVVGLISFVFFAAVAGVMVFFVVASSRGGGGPPVPAILIAVAIALLVILPAAIILGLLMKFTNDFVVPIMYLRLCTCMEGWRQFWPLLTANKGKFALYVLFCILIGLAMGTIACISVLLTCCCVIIPYIGTVILLPLFVFDRAYSLYYLRQYGGDYDCFTGEVVDAPPLAAPQEPQPPQPQPLQPQPTEPQPEAGPTRDEITQDDWFSAGDKGDDLLPPLIDE